MDLSHHAPSLFTLRNFLFLASILTQLPQPHFTAPPGCSNSRGGRVVSFPCHGDRCVSWDSLLFPTAWRSLRLPGTALCCRDISLVPTWHDFPVAPAAPSQARRKLPSSPSLPRSPPRSSACKKNLPQAASYLWRRWNLPGLTCHCTLLTTLLHALCRLTSPSQLPPHSSQPVRALPVCCT